MALHVTQLTTVNCVQTCVTKLSSMIIQHATNDAILNQCGRQHQCSVTTVLNRGSVPHYLKGTAVVLSCSVVVMGTLKREERVAWIGDMREDSGDLDPQLWMPRCC
jgi:hypothetical protein